MENKIKKFIKIIGKLFSALLIFLVGCFVLMFFTEGYINVRYQEIGKIFFLTVYTMIFLISAFIAGKAIEDLFSDFFIAAIISLTIFLIFMFTDVIYRQETGLFLLAVPSFVRGIEKNRFLYNKKLIFAFYSLIDGGILFLLNCFMFFVHFLCFLVMFGVASFD